MSADKRRRARPLSISESEIDEERAALRARAEERAAKLEEVSPPCANAWEYKGKPRSCSHKLNVHNPCSKCACPGFKGAKDETAAEATAALTEAYPDLFPQPKLN
jgi:hypothetical protein